MVMIIIHIFNVVQTPVVVQPAGTLRITSPLAPPTPPDGGKAAHSCAGGQQPRAQQHRPFFYVQPPSQPYFLYQHWQPNHPYGHYGLPGGTETLQPLQLETLVAGSTAATHQGGEAGVLVLLLGSYCLCSNVFCPY